MVPEFWLYAVTYSGVMSQQPNHELWVIDLTSKIIG